MWNVCSNNLALLIAYNYTDNLNKTKEPSYAVTRIKFLGFKHNVVSIWFYGELLKISKLLGM